MLSEAMAGSPPIQSRGSLEGSDASAAKEISTASEFDRWESAESNIGSTVASNARRSSGVGPSCTS